jgi:hypothetical protein
VGPPHREDREIAVCKGLGVGARARRPGLPGGVEGEGGAPRPEHDLVAARGGAASERSSHPAASEDPDLHDAKLAPGLLQNNLFVFN